MAALAMTHGKFTIKNTNVMRELRAVAQIILVSTNQSTRIYREARFIRVVYPGNAYRAPASVRMSLHNWRKAQQKRP